MDRRGFAWVAAAGALAVLGPKPAAASLSRAVRLEDLVSRSQYVVVAEPLDGESVWETIGKRRHIVTYTRIRAIEALSGEEPKQEELMVRTLGGRIGDLGELVHGEAMLTLGQRSVLFTIPARGALAVTAMAQGHYPLARDRAGDERLQRSPAAVEILGEPSAAVQRLPGLDLHATRRLLRQVRK
jgi:hypothetical protein